MHRITCISTNKCSKSSNRKIDVHLLNKLQHYFPAHAPVKILRPNALWTAGCCVYQSSTGTRAESIAVIGNNDMLSNCNPTKSVNLTTLEWLIVDPRATPANIFPGNPDCRMNHYNLSVL